MEHIKLIDGDLLYYDNKGEFDTGISLSKEDYEKLKEMDMKDRLNWFKGLGI